MKKNIGIVVSLLVFSFASLNGESGAAEKTEVAAENSIELEEKKTETVISLENDGPVTGLDVEGLKKTRLKYVERFVEFEGKNASEIDLKKIELDLRVSGLFSKQECSFVRQDDKSYHIKIVVEEKMSYIPLPFAMYSGSGIMFGAFVMNMNAFGMNDKLVTGGLYGPTSWTDWNPRMLMANFMFMRGAKDIKHPGYSIHASVMKRTKQMENQDEDDVVPEFEAFAVKTGISVSEKITKSFSINAGLNYSYSYPENNYFKTDHGFGFSLSSGLSKNSFNGWFLSTDSLSANYKLDYFTENGLMQSVQTRALLQVPVIKRIRFEGSAGYKQSWNTMWNEYDGGGAIGVSILPGHFVSDFLAGGTAGFEFGVLDIGNEEVDAGHFAVYVRGECAGARNYSGDYFFDYGMTAGAKLYLSKINMPAFSFSWSWNMNRPLKDLYSFSLGFGM